MIAWFLRNPVAANLLMISILVLGIRSALELQRESFPQLPPSEVTVSVFYDSGSARQAEENITRKIEQAIRNLSGIKEVTSSSSRTGSTVTIRKDYDADLDKLLHEIKARVDAIVGMPKGAERPVVEVAAEVKPTALRINLYGEVPQGLLQSLAFSLREDLLGKPGITLVELQGYKVPEITIEVDEVGLQTHGLSLRDVSDAVARESLVEVGGALRGEDTIVQLTADAPRYRKEDFADITVRKNPGGSELKLGDVATITDGFSSFPRTWLRYQGKRSVGLRIVVDEHGDITRMTREAHEVLDDWRAQGKLPEGVGIAAWDDKSKFIESRLGALLFNGAAGIILVILLLSLVLEARVAFWVSVGLPVCFAGALIAMGDGILGFSINQISTLGFIVAMGILVDDAIVVGESIHTRQILSPTPEATLEGVRRVAMPTLIGGLTTVVAFSSLAFVFGYFGEFFGQFSLVVAACLVFSMIESKLILPAHLLPRRGTAASPSPRRTHRQTQGGTIAQRFQARFETFKTKLFLPGLQRAIDYRYATLLLLLAIWLLGLGLLTRSEVRQVFFPDISYGVVYVEVTMQPDAGFGATENALDHVEQSAYKTAEDLQREHGLAEPLLTSVRTWMRNDLEGPVLFELPSGSQQAVNIFDFSRRFRKTIDRIEGIKSLRIHNSYAGLPQLDIQLLAPSFEQAQAGRRVLLEKLRQIPGVHDLSRDVDDTIRQIRLEPTPLGRALDLTTQDLARQLQQAFFGFETQRIQRGRDEVKVRVRYPEDARRSLDDLWAMRVRTPDGQVVALETVARAVNERVVGERTRIDGRSAISIEGQVDKTITSPEAVVTEIAQYLPEFHRTHPDVRVDFGGEAEEQKLVMQSLRDILIFVLIVIYALLAIVLKRYGAPLIIMAVIPFAVAGALFGHLLHGLPFSILSLFGVMALIGVVINDSLLLMVRYLELRPGLSSIRDAVLNAAAERVRAILLTSVTTYVGLIPLMANPSIQGAFLKPAAASLAYGVLFGTVITLVLVPILIMIADDVKNLMGRLSLIDHAKSKAKLQHVSD
uniref:Multidrug efflux pump subunit AcrB n=1 Tax=Candidatus Kentrum sp. FW TaxID=2126338 RepID=A0A450THX7_9GAMM|nr:MAG: Multidrug efflux pump subunit AcrB [Candidatus Kentron sp. FW]